MGNCVSGEPTPDPSDNDGPNKEKNELQNIMRMAQDEQDHMDSVEKMETERQHLRINSRVFRDEEFNKMREFEKEVSAILGGEKSSSLSEHNDALTQLIWRAEQLYRNQGAFRNAHRRRGSETEEEEFEVAHFITAILGHTAAFKNSSETKLAELLTNVKSWRRSISTAPVVGQTEPEKKDQEKNPDELNKEQKLNGEKKAEEQFLKKGKIQFQPNTVLYQYYRSLLLLNEWDFSIFDLCAETEGTPLAVVSVMIFHTHYIFRDWNFNEAKFFNFAKAIDRGYNKLPYHNSQHAGDVMQATHYWIYKAEQLYKRGELKMRLYEKMDTLALLFSAMVHDYRHPGFTNQYLIETGHELAIRYNDQSVLENMHVAEAFKLLRDENNNFIANLRRKDQTRFRELVIDTVFKTDMKFHQHVVYDLSKCVEGKVMGEEYRQIIRRCTVHLADISHPTRKNEMHVQWSAKITEEFYNQGDLERAQGIPHQTPIFDRHTNNWIKAQIGFIDFIVKNAFKTFVKVVPSARPCLKHLDRNCLYWNAREKERTKTRSTNDQRRRESRLLLKNSIRL